MRWIVEIGMQKYAETFRPMTGRVRNLPLPESRVTCLCSGEAFPQEQRFVQDLQTMGLMPSSGEMHGLHWARECSNRCQRIPDKLMPYELSQNTIKAALLSIMCSWSVQRLLQLSEDDIAAIVDSKLDAQLLGDALEDLRRRDVSPS